MGWILFGVVSLVGILCFVELESLNVKKKFIFRVAFFDVVEVAFAAFDDVVRVNCLECWYVWNLYVCMM